MNNPAIHISDALAFKRCRQRWNFSSMHRRNLAPVGVYAPFFTGRVIHGALDRLYRYGLDPVGEVDALVQDETRTLAEDPTLYKANLPTIMEQAELCKGLLAHYMMWRKASAKQPYADAQLDFLASEQRFDVPLRTPTGRRSRFRLAGRFDGVVRYKPDNRLYLWEVKTTRSIPERIRMLELEEQANAYAIAAQELLGEPIAGILYTLIRKKLPADPRVLKNGMLSQDTSTDTSYAHFLAAIRQHHGVYATPEFIRANYADILTYLYENERPFIARVMIRRSPEQLTTYRASLYDVAREMFRPDVKVWHSAQPDCNYCIFREPCIALQSGNVQFAEQLLARNYRTNDYHLPTDQDVD